MVDVSGRAVFLSGPMSDDPVTYHSHDFVDAHIALKAKGARRVFDPAVAWLADDSAEEHTHDWWVRRCVNILTTNFGGFDLLVSLPGWRESPGATLERTVAEGCGIECVELSEVL